MQVTFSGDFANAGEESGSCHVPRTHDGVVDNDRRRGGLVLDHVGLLQSGRVQRRSAFVCAAEPRVL